LSPLFALAIFQLVDIILEWKRSTCLSVWQLW